MRVPRHEKRPEIQAVTFDAGGTLLSPWPSVGEIYSKEAKEVGLGSFDAADLNARFVQAWRMKGAFDYSRQAWKKLLDEVFRGLASVDREFFDALYNRFAQPDAWRVFDDAIPCLETLANEGYRMAVLSNWDERLRPLLVGLGLDQFFYAIVVSREVRAAKPSGEIFQSAACRLGLEPDRIIHAGDNRAEDFLGAQSAGFQAVLVQRGGGLAEDGTISTLSDLPRLLERG